MLRFRCPECETPMEVDESFAGRSARCPTCGHTLRVPKAEPSPGPVPRVDGQPSGPNTVRVHGESVEVRPPLETLAVVGPALAALAVVAFLLLGLDPFGISYSSWLVGFTVGAMLSLLAAVFGLSGYQSVLRSRGRKSGRLPALIGTFGGLGLFIVLGAGAVVLSVKAFVLRPTCEDNLKVIYKGLKDYAAAHEGKLPRNLEELVREKYVDSNRWFTCPAYRVSVGTQTYRLMPLIDMNDPLYPPDMMIVADGEPIDSHRDGNVCVLLKDGTVTTVPRARWDAYFTAQQRKYTEVLRQLRKRAEASGAAPEGGGSEPPAPKEAPAGPAPAPSPAEEEAK